jgi:uncharacterized protein (UPF0335 family)
MRLSIFILFFIISCQKEEKKQEPSEVNKPEVVTESEYKIDPKIEALEKEKSAIWENVSDLYKNQKFDEAKKQVETLLDEKFSVLEEPEVDLSVQVKNMISEIECNKMDAGKVKPRSAEETLKKLLVAINQKDKNQIRNLLSCSLYAASHENFWYPSPSDKISVSDILLAKINPGAKTHSKTIPQGFDRHGFEFVITNETSKMDDDIYLSIQDPTPFPGVYQIDGVIWDFKLEQ